MEKFVQVYFYGGRFILSPMARTEKGMLMSIGTCREIGLSGSEIETGHEILRGLDQFQLGLPHPDLRNSIESETPILKFLGIKRYSKLMDSAKLVSLKQSGDIIRFKPKKNEGKKGGYTELLESEFDVDAGSIEKLFPALSKAFELCV